MSDADPICAIATAPGRGGIGVVRVSGRDVSTIARALTGRDLAPRLATYTPFLDADGHEIDRGIALHFPSPHSYTGEDVLELQGHGGPVVMQLLLRRVLQAGAAQRLRLAEPGEFTRRAFLNDKLDLAQAEAVADLIDAGTEQAARSASRSLAGVFSQRIHDLVDRVIHLRMLVEATLDFPEEEIEFLEASDARGQLALIRAALDDVLAHAKQGALLREGLNVVLAGEPNVGKSSLLNALAGAEVAIVTAIPGTTRDRVEQAIQIDGVPVNVIDTAGLRETADEVERLGIERTLQALEKADVVLWLREAGAEPVAGQGADGVTGSNAPAHSVRGGTSVASASAAIDPRVAERLPAGVPVVQVFNKIDLAGIDAHRDADRAVWLSAKTGAGIDALRMLLLSIAGWQGAGESTFIARERHLLALRAAAEHLLRADRMGQQGDAQLDLFAEELRLAQERLNTITGEFGADELLGVIFSRFCIGK